MLPDLHEFRSWVAAEYRERLQRNHSGGLVSEMRRIEYIEGTEMVSERLGTTDEDPLTASSVISVSEELTLDTNRIIEEGFYYAFEFAEQLGSKVHASKTRAAFTSLNDVLERNGQVLTRAVLDKEAMLDLYKSVEVDYDDDGKPTASFMIHPSMEATLKQLTAEVENDAEYKRRWDEEEARKRKDFHDREARTQLVD